MIYSCNVELIFDHDLEGFSKEDFEELTDSLNDLITRIGGRADQPWDFGSGNSAVGKFLLPYDFTKIINLFGKSIGTFYQVPLKIDHCRIYHA